MSCDFLCAITHHKYMDLSSNKVNSISPDVEPTRTTLTNYQPNLILVLFGCQLRMRYDLT